MTNDGGVPAPPLTLGSLAVYAVVAVAVALLTTRRPVAGIAALVAIEPFGYYRSFFGTDLTMAKAAVLGLIAGIVLDARPRTRDIGGGARLIMVAQGFVALATAISVVGALHVVPVARETAKALGYAILFASVAVAARRDRDRHVIAYAIAATAVVVAALAAAFVGGRGEQVMLSSGAILPRLAGPLEGPNQLGGYLAITLPLTLALLRIVPIRWPLVLSLSVQGAVLGLTQSRGGIATAAIACAIVALFSPRGARRATSLFAAIALAFGGVAIGIESLVATHRLDGLWRAFTAEHPEATGGVGNRTELWRAAWRLASAHPLTGIGAGNFELEVGSLVPGVRTHANSWFLQSLVEGGIVLELATIALVVVVLVTLARSARRDAFALGAFAASAGFALHGVFDFLIFYPKVGDLWWIAVAVGTAPVARLAFASRGRSAIE